MASHTSVIVPVRNGVRFIDEALDSVLRQLAPDDEILVVDDASTDATRLVLARIQDPRVWILDGSGRGVSSARNIGLAAATGEFIAFLDHDDLWPAERHQRMMQAMMNDPQLDAVYGRIRIRIDPGGIRWPWLPQDGCHRPGSYLGNALFRISILRRIGGFDESLRFGEDFDYFNRLQEAGMAISLCDVDSLISRRHATNCSNDLRAVRKAAFDVIRRRIARTGGSKARIAIENQ
jgi:glycosyltransferase involved in cell wall biosynthesis